MISKIYISNKSNQRHSQKLNISKYLNNFFHFNKKSSYFVEQVKSLLF